MRKTLAIILYILIVSIGINQALFATTKLDSLLTKLENTPKNNTEEKADIIFAIGMEYFQYANFEKALEKSFEALSLYEEINKQDKISSTYNIIGIIYKRSNKYELALSYFEKALEIEKQIGNNENIGAILGNIGVAYASLSMHEVALKYYLEAERYLKKIKNANLSVNLNNIGWTYYLLEEYDKSIEYYKNAIEETQIYNDSSQLIITLNNIGLSFKEKNELDSAEFYISQSFLLSKNINEPYSLLRILYSYAEVLKEKKKYKEATQYLFEYIELNDSIYSFESQRKFEELQIRYETEQKEQEIELLKQKDLLKTQRTQLLILIVSLIILLAFLFLYRFYTQKKRIADKLVISKLKREKLNEELDIKNQQLTNFALLTVERNEFIATLNNHIKLLKREEKINNNSKFKDLAAAINSYVLNYKNRQLFEKQMGEAYEVFFKKLQKKFPNLTQSEKNLAALLRLKLSSKEIASLMNISSKSIDTYRYNLKKKLNLKAEDNLVSVLSQL